MKSTKVTGIINKQNATLVVITVAGLEINKNAGEFKKSRYKSKRKLNKGSSKNNERKNTKKKKLNTTGRDSEYTARKHKLTNKGGERTN